MTEVLQDKLLRNMDAAGMRATFAAKAVGAAHLHHSLMRDRVDALTCFSSAAATYGNVGSGNHAAACAFLDSLTLSRSAAAMPSHTLALPATLGAGSAEATFGAGGVGASRRVFTISVAELLASVSVVLAIPLAHSTTTILPRQEEDIAADLQPLLEAPAVRPVALWRRRCFRPVALGRLDSFGRPKALRCARRRHPLAVNRSGIAAFGNGCARVCESSSIGLRRLGLRRLGLRRL